MDGVIVGWMGGWMHEPITGWVELQGKILHCALDAPHCRLTLHPATLGTSHLSVSSHALAPWIMLPLKLIMLSLILQASLVM